MTAASPKNSPLRVLIVDDSAFNRRNISEILSAAPEVEVVGKASDGEEAIRQVTLLRPDVITLDLEMPKMDGFTFLRILMSKMPTPVVVVSSYSQKENVFKALELGALDFVAKPDRRSDADFAGIRQDLLHKVLMARSVRPGQVLRPRVWEQEQVSAAAAKSVRPAIGPPPRFIVAIASSTGGPTALMEIFATLPATSKNAYLVAQHMPEKFTRTFAERLDRRSAISVSEAQDGDAVAQATAFVCPGRRCMALELPQGGSLRVKVTPPDESDRYIPSADRLFTSVANVAGNRAVGVILTGMGDDGTLGAQAILEKGGIVIAESEASAVVYGMPGAAVRAKAVSRSSPLNEIGVFLSRL